MPVNPNRMRNPRYTMMAVAAAGPLTNLVLAAIGAVALGLFARVVTAPPGLAAGFVILVLTYFILINIFLALFNLLPIPPFDGSHIVEGLLPRDAARAYARLRPYGFLLLFTALLVIPWLFPGLGIIDRVLLPPVNWAQDKYFALAQWVAGKAI